MDIQKVKARLNELGYGRPPLDVTNAAYGNKTMTAIRLFQSENGLSADGKIGPATLSKLFPPDIHGNNEESKLKSLSENMSFVLSIRAMQIAISQNGVREMTGKNDGEAVETYLASIGLAKGYSWCMAFVYWCYEQAAGQLGVSNPLVKTGGCIRQWNESRVRHTDRPEVGAVFIMDYGKGNGHTGFVTRIDGAYIQTVEGNTNNTGSSNGDGVYYPRKRLIGYSKMKGFLIP